MSWDHSLPKNYSAVETQDGSFTLYSEQFNENCHSTSGAVEETKLHYLKACDVYHKAQTQERVRILEVGFGLGIGWEITHEVLGDLAHKIDFVSLEIDGDLVKWAIEKRNLPQKNLRVLIGDARKTLRVFRESYPNIKFDCIYQDPFSPRRNPELWTKQWFELLKSVSNEQTIMSTYSASSSIRKSMLVAGWNLREGHQFGPKRSATIASLTGQTDPSIIEKLERSPAEILTESNIDSYRKIK